MFCHLDMKRKTLILKYSNTVRKKYINNNIYKSQICSPEIFCSVLFGRSDHLSCWLVWNTLKKNVKITLSLDAKCAGGKTAKISLLWSNQHFCCCMSTFLQQILKKKDCIDSCNPVWQILQATVDVSHWRFCKVVR